VTRVARPARRAHRGAGGQATVELALALPLVALLLLAVVQAALVARDQVLVTHAAREGARAAAVSAEADAARRAVEQAGPLRVADLEVTVSGRGEVGSRVRVEVRYRASPRVPGADLILGDIELVGSATMRVER
jgi:Flp pilus assembly protein TadG